ncbi:DUF1612 domain-containing protein [Mesorhizobium sp. M0437]
MPRERRRARNCSDRLLAFVDAIHDAALVGLKEHDRLVPVEEQPIASDNTFPVEDTGMPDAELEAALAGARARGRKRVAEIVAGEDMLSADAFAKLLGTSRVTVNARRQSGRVLGINGAKRGFRFPVWQLDKDGRPFGALPALHAMLGNSAWAVYRFLVSRHGALDGRTGLRALQQGDDASVLAAAEGMARGDFD